MTVSEPIEQLKKMPPEADVQAAVDGDQRDVTDIYDDGHYIVLSLLD